MAGEGKGFKIAAGFVEVNLKDNTQADLAAIRARIEDAPAAELKIGLDTASRDHLLGDVAALRTRIDADPAKIRVEVDDRSLATARAKIAATVEQAGATESAGGRSSGGGGVTSGLGFAGLVAGGIGVGAGPLAGASLLALPAVFAAIGIAAEKSNAQVTQSLSGLESTAKRVATDGFAPMVPAIVGVANQAKTTIQGLEPQFEQAAVAANPLLQAVSTGLLTATKDGVGGAIPILQSLKPEAQALGDDFVKVGSGIGGFFRNIDTSAASQGLAVLGTDLQEILPAVGSLLSEVMPLGNAILAVLGPALRNTASDLGVLTPLLDATGAVISFLGPDIETLGPPLLAVMATTKLLTGSWLDFGAAAGKLKGFVTDMPQTLQDLAGKLGYTTDAAKASAVADAELALSKARLKAEADAETAAELASAAATSGSARDRLLLKEATDTAAASARAATIAEKDLAVASEASTFSFGPLGIAIAAAGVLLLPFITSSEKATTTTQDLTQQLVQLATAAPNAAAGVATGDPALTSLINKARQAGVDVHALLAAYQAGPSALQAFSDGLSHQHQALGDQSAAIDGTTAALLSNDQITDATSETVKQLASDVGGNHAAYESLSPAVRALVDQYNAQNDIQGQLGTSVDTLTQQQAAAAAVTTTGRAATTQWTSAILAASYALPQMGGSLLGLTQQMYQWEIANNQASFSAEGFFKSQVTAAQGNVQAGQSFQQLGQAVSQASHSYDQAVASVADAAHSERQAAQGVADAQHGLAQSAQGVVTAEQGVQTALQGVQSAELNLTNAQHQQAQAQQQLTQARAQAAQQLQDLARQVTDQSSTEESAAIRLAQAQQAVNQAGLANSNLKLTDLYNQKNITATNIQQYQLLLDLQSAQQNYNDTLAQGATLRQQKTAADRAGIDGNQQVISAQQGVQQANDQERNAVLALAAAQQQVAKAYQAVQDAQYAEMKASQAVAEAHYSEQRAHQAVGQAVWAENQASLALTIAKDANSRSTDINTVAGNRNVQTIIGLYDNQIAAGKSVDQARVEVEKETGSLGFNRQAVDDVITSIRNIPPNTPFAITGVPSLDLNALVKSAQAQGIDPFSLGLPAAVVRPIVQPGPWATKAAGGVVEGYSPTAAADNIPMLATAGEYMQPVDAVRHYGMGFMEAVRAKKLKVGTDGAALPGFAAGGPIEQAIGANTRLLLVDALSASVSGITRTLGGTAPWLPTGPGSLFPPNMLAGSGAGGAMPNLAGIRGSNEAIVQQVFEQMFGWGHGPEWAATIPLIMMESGFNNLAQNPTSTAFGIFQFLDSTWAGYGVGKTADPRMQAVAGARYIKSRYGNPLGALAHERAFHWYDSGGYLAPGAIGGNTTGDREMVLPPGLTQTLEALHALVQAGGLGRSVAAPTVNQYITAAANQSPEHIGALAAAHTQWVLSTARGG